MISVAIIMSTYNGEKYIINQINSILKQKKILLKIFIRDDGSTDNTLNILKNIKDSRLKFYQGENIGPCKSFLELVSNIEGEFDYYAFADQDDIWDEYKIITAIDAIKQRNDLPCLYYSALNFCDENMNFKYKNINKLCINFKFSLIRSLFPGCTMVFNNKAMNLVKKHKFTSQVMHDQLLFQIVCGVGGYIYYDKNSHINYRIHSTNVSNYENPLKKINKLIIDVNDCSNKRLKALQELYCNYKDIFLPENAQILLSIISYQEKNLIDKIRLISGYNDYLKYKFKYLLSILINRF